jgi:hypothetical protein
MFNKGSRLMFNKGYMFMGCQTPLMAPVPTPAPMHYKIKHKVGAPHAASLQTRGPVMFHAAQPVEQAMMG